MDGSKVREARIKKGLSVSELAERVGVTQGYMSAIELGHKQVRYLDLMVRIAQALGCKTSDLMEVE